MKKEQPSQQYQPLKQKIKLPENLNINLIIAISCFIFIFITIVIIIIINLLKPGLLYSPPETIGEFLKSLDPDIHKISYINPDSQEEKTIINNFISLYIPTIQQTEKVKSDTLTIGTISPTSNKPFSTYLKNNQAIAIYDTGTNNLYIYSNNLENLKTTLALLNTNISYSKIKIINNQIERLAI